MSAWWRTQGSQHLSPPQNSKIINNYKSDENGSGKALEHNKEVEETLQTSETKDSCKEKHRKHFTCTVPPWVQAPELSCCHPSTAPMARVGHWAIIAMQATTSSWPLGQKHHCTLASQDLCCFWSPHTHRAHVTAMSPRDADFSSSGNTHRPASQTPKQPPQTVHLCPRTQMLWLLCKHLTPKTLALLLHGVSPYQAWHQEGSTKIKHLPRCIEKERTPASLTSEDYNGPSSHCHSEILCSLGRRKSKDDFSYERCTETAPLWPPWNQRCWTLPGRHPCRQL